MSHAGGASGGALDAFGASEGGALGGSRSDGAGELAVAAARAERRNRPVGWVMLGALVLLAGAIFALVGWNGHVGAKQRAKLAETNAKRMLEAGAKLKALKEAEAAGGGARVVESGTNILSKIESAGPRAGLKKPVGVGSRSTIPDRALGWNQTRYSYNVRDESVASLIAWTQLVVAELPGLEVQSFTLRPEASEWSVSIVFSRWEKAEGA